MAERWQVDLIETELSRAGPDGMDKKELQEAVGLGTDDLRAALSDAEEAGVLEVRGDRYVVPDVGALGQDPDDPAEAFEEMEHQPPVEEDDDPSAPEPRREPIGDVAEAIAAEPEPVYRARIVIEAEFRPDASDGPGDDGALEAADKLRNLAVSGIQSIHGDMRVVGRVEAVHAFEVPRQVFP